MNKPADSILTLNGGSSSIKFAFYAVGEPPVRGQYEQIDRLGTPDARLSFTNPATQPANQLPAGEVSTVDGLLDWLAEQTPFGRVKAIGHRVVHGWQHTEVRSRVCAGLDFLGLHIDEVQNSANAPVISTADSQVTAWLIPTDEQCMIACLVCQLLNFTIE